MAQATGSPIKPRVLVVMDDPLARVLATVLDDGRYETQLTLDPTEFARSLREWAPHVVLMDLDAHHEFLKLSQARDGRVVPIVVFTRRRETALKLGAYQEGADDILRIPFLLGEIFARLYAVVRRAHGIEVPLPPRLRLDSIEIDLVEERLHVPGRDPIALTLTESTLLYLLAANAGSTVDRDDIISSIWDGVFEVESNAVDRHIRDLRIKLGDTWPSSHYIETIPGKGYRWRRH